MVVDLLERLAERTRGVQAQDAVVAGAVLSLLSVGGTVGGGTVLLPLVVVVVAAAAAVSGPVVGEVDESMMLWCTQLRNRCGGERDKGKGQGK